MQTKRFLKEIYLNVTSTFDGIVGLFKDDHAGKQLYALIKDKQVQDFIYWDGSYENYNFPDSVSLLLLHDALDVHIGSVWNGSNWEHPLKGK